MLSISPALTHHFNTSFSRQDHCSHSLFLHSHVCSVAAAEQLLKSPRVPQSPLHCLSGPLLSKLPSLRCKVAVVLAWIKLQDHCALSPHIPIQLGLMWEHWELHLE